MEGRGKLSVGDGPVKEVDSGSTAQVAGVDDIGESLRVEGEGGVEARGGESSVEGCATGGLVEEDHAEAVREGREEGGRRSGSWTRIGFNGLEGNGKGSRFVGVTGGEEADGGDDHVLGGGVAEATTEKAAGHLLVEAGSGLGTAAASMWHGEVGQLMRINGNKK